jgi:hypothetical protein
MYLIITTRADGTDRADLTVYTTKARAEKVAQSMQDFYDGCKATQGWKVEVVEAEVVDW